jgi:hypothetical protein
MWAMLGDAMRCWVVLGGAGWCWVVLSDAVWCCVMLGVAGWCWVMLGGSVCEKCAHSRCKILRDRDVHSCCSMLCEMDVLQRGRLVGAIFPGRAGRAGESTRDGVLAVRTAGDESGIEGASVALDRVRLVRIWQAHVFKSDLEDR